MLDLVEVTDLIHLLQSLLAHALQRADLPRLLPPREVHISEATLTDLRDNVELVHAKLGTSSAKYYALAATVRFPFLQVFAVGESTRRGVFVKALTSLFPGRKISKHLKVVIQKVYTV